jgi:hypothetical protein
MPQLRACDSALRFIFEGANVHHKKMFVGEIAPQLVTPFCWLESALCKSNTDIHGLWQTLSLPHETCHVGAGKKQDSEEKCFPPPPDARQ